MDLNAFIAVIVMITPTGEIVIKSNPIVFDTLSECMYSAVTTSEMLASITEEYTSINASCLTIRNTRGI